MNDDAADRAAKHLANLIGASVAGQQPERSPILSEELFVRRNVILASLVIVAGYLNGDARTRDLLSRQVDPILLREKSIEWYMYRAMAALQAERGDFSQDDVQHALTQFGPDVWGEPTEELSASRWNQITLLRPSQAELLQAIELRKSWAAKQGLV